jgi:hypothetical protein
MQVAGSLSIATIVVVSEVIEIKEHDEDESVHDNIGDGVIVICESSARSSALAFVSDCELQGVDRAPVSGRTVEAAADMQPFSFLPTLAIRTE